MSGQSKEIKDLINQLIDQGMTDKSDIYSKVVEQTKYPRPTVRRCAAELVKEYKHRVEILSPEIEEPQVVH